MDYRAIPLASIVIGERLRALDPGWVALLAEEIGRDGQTTPIRVVARGDGFMLIDGARRLAALSKLGRATVTAQIEPEEALANAALVRLGETKGNLMRGGLTMLDRAMAIAAWRDVYLSVQTLPKRGRRPGAEKSVRVTNISCPGAKPAKEDAPDAFILSLAEAAHRALNLSQKTLWRHLQIARIGTERAARLVGHPSADNQRESLLLSEQSIERQAKIIDLLLSDTAMSVTVRDAIDFLEPSLIGVREASIS